MCGPWVIPLALMAGGGVAKYLGDQQAAHAERDASNAERARQQALAQQQDALVNNSIGKVGAITTGGLDTSIANRKAAITANMGTVSPTQGFLPGSSSADASVGGLGDKIVAGEKSLSGGVGDASARLNGLGDSLFGANIAVNRNDQGVNQLGSEKMQSAAVLPYELKAAATKGSLLRGLGGLAQSIGSMVAGAGLAGGGNALGSSMSSLSGSMLKGADFSGLPAFTVS